MKKLFLIITAIFAVTAINAQSLEEIVKKYSAAIKADQLASITDHQDHWQNVDDGNGNANGQCG